ICSCNEGGAFRFCRGSVLLCQGQPFNVVQLPNFDFPHQPFKQLPHGRRRGRPNQVNAEAASVGGLFHSTRCSGSCYHPRMEPATGRFWICEWPVPASTSSEGIGSLQSWRGRLAIVLCSGAVPPAAMPLSRIIEPLIRLNAGPLPKRKNNEGGSS